MMAIRLIPHCPSKINENSLPKGLFTPLISTYRLCHSKIMMSRVLPLNALSLDASLAPSPSFEGFRTQTKEDGFAFSPSKLEESEASLSIIVVGASGEHASNKIFPALFALFYEDRLPKSFTIFGYARTKMTDEELRMKISNTLTCRVDDKGDCNKKMDEFLSRCFYHSGQYSSEEHFSEFNNKLKEAEGGRRSNRLFYMAIPPSIYEDVARCAKNRASSEHGWTRVIVKKPLDCDSEPSSEITSCLKQHFTEDQIFRFDHHLGKELVEILENLLVLRFSNLVFEPLWSRNYIRNVQLIFSEDLGAEGRGRYFDNYGIIRDTMQNHLLHLLALFAMETPVSIDAEDIRNEKVKVLRSIRPPRLGDAVLGQYKGFQDGERWVPGYTDEPSVCKDSLNPTFAAATLFINNARWDGVPFFLVAGKGLDSKRVEIRVQFRHVPGNLYKKKYGADLDKATNELVIRVQPDEAIYLKINNKVPGLGMRLDCTDLNLFFKSSNSTHFLMQNLFINLTTPQHARWLKSYPKEIPDAFERLLMDAVEGERRLFIRSDEVEAVRALFRPLLEELEKKKTLPELYRYGSRGPLGVHYLAARHNVHWRDL
ncbi:LOW QUALITY PROTEIN: hypothetical protein V2J09_020747 [Rumex salicifolius]